MTKTTHTESNDEQTPPDRIWMRAEVLASPELREHFIKLNNDDIEYTRVSANVVAPTVDRDIEREGFPWGTEITIHGVDYWLNQCSPCPSTGQRTYHVIKGQPQPSLNELMEEDEHTPACFYCSPCVS